MDPRGLNLVFTGIDGIGKSTVAAGVAAELRSAGHTVVTPSWREYLRPDSADPRSSVLGPALLSTLGALYAGARDRHGKAVLENLTSGGDRTGSGTERPRVTEETLGQLDIAANRPDTLLAAGLSMLSAQLLLHELVIRPALAEGHVVIQDSYGVKAIVKSILLAEQSGAETEESFDTTVTHGFRTFAHMCLRRSAAPSLGVLLTGNPKHVERRKSDDRDISATEHFALAGGGAGALSSATATFVPFQELVQQELRAFAQGAPWVEIEITDAPKEESVASGVADVLALLPPFGRGVARR